jgi:hypothetical protein
MAIPGRSSVASLGRRIATVLIAGALIAAALVAYHRELLFGGYFDALDWQQHLHFYEWIHRSLREHGALPLYLRANTRPGRTAWPGCPSHPFSTRSSGCFTSCMPRPT